VNDVGMQGEDLKGRCATEQFHRNRRLDRRVSLKVSWLRGELQLTLGSCEIFDTGEAGRVNPRCSRPPPQICCSFSLYLLDIEETKLPSPLLDLTVCSRQQSRLCVL